MDLRNPNNAKVIIAMGVYLLLGALFGYFLLSGIIIILLGLYRFRLTKDRLTYVIIGLGFIILLSDQFFIFVAIVLISLGYFYLKSRRVHQGSHYVQRQGVFENLKHTKDAWVLSNMSLWHLFGEIKLDFSLVWFEEEEINLVIQGAVGDIDLMLPENIGVSIQSSVLLGRIQVRDLKDSGIMNKIVWKSDNYDHANQKINIELSYIMGHVDAKII